MAKIRILKNSLYQPRRHRSNPELASEQEAYQGILEAGLNDTSDEIPPHILERLEHRKRTSTPASFESWEEVLARLENGG